MSQRKRPTISSDVWKYTRSPLGRAVFLSFWTLLTYHLARAPEVVVVEVKDD